MNEFTLKIAQELQVNAPQVDAAVNLLDGGASVPFIARYRKEATQGLSDDQLRDLAERLSYLRELGTRRITILKTIEQQGKLTAHLEKSLLAADTKTELEDLYLPYKQKRKTKAHLARVAGLDGLAQALLSNPTLEPEVEAVEYIDPSTGIDDVKSALEGAKQILMEDFSQIAPLLISIRHYLWEHAVIKSVLMADSTEKSIKFTDYFDFEELIKKIPSHRILALFRGRNEGVLGLELVVDKDAVGISPIENMIAQQVGVSLNGRAADQWLQQVVRWTWKIKIFTRLDLEIKTQLKAQADEEAIKVFGFNLKDLLLAAPAGALPILGLDPGIRTGVKVAMIDATGQLQEYATIYPHAPKHQWDQSIDVLAKILKGHKHVLIAIGNGTASRETDKLAGDLIKRHPELGLRKIVVSEAGASVYSASELASKELSGVDVSIRGAVSIARRLQDPLSELVKIEPKAIGVGQYQHDVNQLQLSKALDGVVEDCVNAVGVDVNTASVALLQQVSGLSKTHAENIVQFRNEHGRFITRKKLLSVPRLGAKTYEQAAAFLRIRDGDNALDNSAVHPEAYLLVKKIVSSLGKPLAAVMGDVQSLKALNPQNFVQQNFGLPTVMDILLELEKPGRDPRGEFTTASFKEGVESMSDLTVDMILEGIVTNVTNFGAFVDIGVHQDGLVHISALANKFVKDPREVVKTGSTVKVKVMAVDVKRKRIALSMRLSDDARQHTGHTTSTGVNKPFKKRVSPAQKKEQTHGNMATALAQALAGK